MGVNVLGPSHYVSVGRIETLKTGDRAGEGNVIAGNTLGGVQLDGTMNGAQVMANHIGIGADGQTALGNGLGPGIRVFADNVAIGEEGAGANLIAGHNGHGIQIGDEFGQDPTGTRVIGNLIGVDAAGDTGVANFGTAVRMYDGADAHISHNLTGANNHGIIVHGHTSEIFGNYVGTNADGIDLGNLGTGIGSHGFGNEIGREGGLGNTVGFCFAGIETSSTASGNLIRANFVGTDGAERDLGNREGIVVRGMSNIVGGSLPGQGNTIGHSQFEGIQLMLQTAGNVVAGNFIGTNAAGADLGNRGHGIGVLESSSNTIGGDSLTPDASLPSLRNVIAFNDLAGIKIDEPFSPTNPTSLSIALRGNEMHDNGGLAIDLDLAGPDVNDPNDSDLGANNRQNSPEIDASMTRYVDETGLVEVRYRVDSDPAHSAYPLKVDFYEVSTDGEEAGRWLGSDTYLATDAGLERSASFVPASPVDGTAYVVAVATDDDDNSSEQGNLVPLPEPDLAIALICAAPLFAGLGRRPNDA